MNLACNKYSPSFKEHTMKRTQDDKTTCVPSSAPASPKHAKASHTVAFQIHSPM